MKVNPVPPVIPMRKELPRPCKFIVRDGVCRYVLESYEPDPGARPATAMEAANYIDRLIINGHPGMVDAEADFKRIYG